MSMDDMLYDAARDAAQEAADSVRDELLNELRSEMLDVEQRFNEIDDTIERTDNAVLEHLGHYSDDVIDVLSQKIDRLGQRLADAMKGSRERGVKLDQLFEAVFDTASSESRQHFIDTGRYLTWTEVHSEHLADDGFVERESYPRWDGPIRDDQRKMIFGLLHALGWDGNRNGAKYNRLATVQAILRHAQPYTSFTQLSEDDARRVIDGLTLALDVTTSVLA